MIAGEIDIPEREPLTAVVLPPPEGARSWRRLNDAVERLAFMSVYGIVTLGHLQILLSLAQLGGSADADVLRRNSGEFSTVVFEAGIERLCEARNGDQQSGVLRRAGDRIEITYEGIEAVACWADPLTPAKVPSLPAPTLATEDAIAV